MISSLRNNLHSEVKQPRPKDQFMKIPAMRGGSNIFDLGDECQFAKHPSQGHPPRPQQAAVMLEPS